ncbi:PREDICTED: uncharacterized protein LOC106813368, partial [Priapulus caudatus]|uniref:Uncharacterized protein LOC106813368 n=1 Tax=Priapulus caudatus TaxID=37621 RepID=A0ABM1ELB4_PRICU
MLVSTFTLHRCLLLALLFTGGLGGQTRTLRSAKTSARPAVGSSDDTVVYRAVDVLQPTTNSSVFHLRQLSRGGELLRMLYAADGMLADCVWSREADDVAEFTGRFDATHADNANAATVADDDDDATPNVNFDSAKKECLSLHKMDGVAADDVSRMRSNHVRRRRAVLYPGTNWCGRGNQARNFNDLGREEHADRCCRQHDHCPTTIRSLSSRYNYFNYRLHTISHCECDNTYVFISILTFSPQQHPHPQQQICILSSNPHLQAACLTAQQHPSPQQAFLILSSILSSSSSILDPQSSIHSSSVSILLTYTAAILIRAATHPHPSSIASSSDSILILSRHPHPQAASRHLQQLPTLSKAFSSSAASSILSSILIQQHPAILSTSCFHQQHPHPQQQILMPQQDPSLLQQHPHASSILFTTIALQSVGLSVGNIAGIRTFRVLRALKTVSIVPASPRSPIQNDSQQAEAPESAAQLNTVKLKPRVEKPKLPVFCGDVREYWTFREDFKHMVDPLYDPRVGCHNILKQVGKESDLNNNHMLAIIEMKLTADDRKVYARHLQQKKEEASLQGLLSFLTEEMKARMRATAPVRNNPPQGKVNLTQQRGSAPGSYPNRSVPWKKCWGCESNDHWPDQCTVIQGLTIDARLEMAKEKHACFSCLKRAGREHSMRTCHRRKQCIKENCPSYHHVLLHRMSGGNIVAMASEENDVALPIITARVGTPGKTVVGNIMMDSGANVTLVRGAVAEQLGLKGKSISVDIGTLGGDVQAYQTKVYKLRIFGDKKVHTILAVGVPEITNVLGHSLNRGNGAVDVLIGVDYPAMHAGETKEVDGYLLRKSPLGWLTFGSSRGYRQPTTTVLHVNVTEMTDLTKFWSTEEMGVKLTSCECKTSDQLKRSPIERQQFNDMWQSCEKIGNRWMVPYPWKRDPRDLPDNKKQCMAKLASMEQRLIKDERNAKVYDQQMKEMEEKGFARKLSNEEMENYKGPVHYISHHPVLRPEKKSTPVRIVFNASAAFNGHRLNDYWEKGPDLLNDMFGVLLRFRQHAVAISGDISKMYHQVLIPEKDKHVHRFLWRNYDVTREPDVYMKEVVTFGDKPAPAMALTALKRTAKEGEVACPKAAKIINHDTYMDDICTSVPSTEEARVVINEMDTVLERGGFTVKEWVSNVRLRSYDTQQGERPVLGDSEEQKVLGMVWDPESDRMKYKVKPVSIKEKDLLTKRMVLSELAKVFDPIGFTGAFLIKGKILMQKLWQCGTGWDEDLPVEEKDEWRKFFAELESLDGVCFQRCLMPERPSKPAELVIFCDASEDAFGAVAYMRWELNDGSVGVRFMAAKSRVAPLRHLSIPRLELQAAVVASRL